mmetsp:Transcript_5852/g.6846  ORF Transcript_5852/g.6846 Transcript_5852/m.6846 type:complete len:86 (-) Transcript_5852:30-287(-)
MKYQSIRVRKMSALFNFQGFLTIIILLICTASYVRETKLNSILNLDAHKHGFRGIIRKFAVIGDRLSPYVSVSCIVFAFANLFFR